jgi:hypothetical protein
MDPVQEVLPQFQEYRSTIPVQGPKIVITFPMTALPGACIEIRFLFDTAFHHSAHFISGVFLLEAAGAGFTGPVNGMIDDGDAISPSVSLTIGEQQAGWSGGRTARHDDILSRRGGYMGVCVSLDPDHLPDPNWKGSGHVLMLTDGTEPFEVAVRSPGINWTIATGSDMQRYVLDDFAATAHATLGLPSAGLDYELALSDPFGEHRTLAVFAPRAGIEMPWDSYNPAGWGWRMDHPDGSWEGTSRAAMHSAAGGGDWRFAFDGFLGGSEGERPVLWLTTW